MRQTGLFDNALEQSTSNVGSACVANTRTVRFFPDFNGWLSEALNYLQHNVPPSSVWWVEDKTIDRTPRAAKSRSGVSQDFTQRAHAASCHSNEDRWALMYQVLWRLNRGEPHLMELTGDSEVAKLCKYAKAVARDVHKMKAFVRFREVQANQNSKQPRYVAWFEPQHYITEYAAPFFKRRFSNMQWSILTPSACAHWEGGGELWFTDGVDQSVAPSSDKFEDAWRVYYKSIFNPARLKITAMQSEMPKKYWKNLPEAKEIRALIQGAEQRTRQMIDQRKDSDELHCGNRPEHPDQVIKVQLENNQLPSIKTLKLQASLCSDCTHGQMSTQTVFGEGPEDAQIMIIGEQPGDKEDLEGRPFVGPAGRLLDYSLEKVGFVREECYLTNAVKHFGFVPRGKKRLHQKPNASVVSACSHWLQQEIEIVDPTLIIYLGLTAAQSRLGNKVRIGRDRGIIIDHGKYHVITAHPSSILRQPDDASRKRELQAFVNDLWFAKEHLYRQSTVPA